MCTKLQLNVNLFPVICCLIEVNTFCGHVRLKIVSSAYFNVEIFRRIASSVKRLRILVFKSSCQHFTLENMGFNVAYGCLLEITKTNRREYFTFPFCK